MIIFKKYFNSFRIFFWVISCKVLVGYVKKGKMFFFLVMVIRYIVKKRKIKNINKESGCVIFVLSSCEIFFYCFFVGLILVGL